MSAFVPPAGLGSVVPSSPSMGVQISSYDQIHVEALYGLTFYGGGVFSDTLGGFYPFVITPRPSTVGIGGGRLTLNGSSANVTSVYFHNTAAAVTDMAISMGDTGAIFIRPNSASQVLSQPLVITDRTTATYLGWIFYPAFTSGTTHPLLQVADPAGTVTTLYFNGTTFSDLSSNGAEYLSIQGVASGSRPFIAAAGTDTNIDIRLSPKGNGVISIDVSSIAQGGGAAATLGTIGGSGPTVAGQNTWWPFKIGATTVFIPIWI